ncbi:MAG TPA: sensor domain-containing diguanylate cyclase [Solirubrobacteraceae bacterium]|nr:sensor domain-containing diguanylate cyclase [Solirubrobacteraceae bacterium]
MGSTGTDTSGPPRDSDPGPEGAERIGGEALSRAALELSPERADPLLAGVRRLTLLADSAGDGEAIFRGLARELLLAPGAEEVHVHHLASPPAEEELVVVYLFEGDGRLSYLAPRSERPPGVGWVAGAARSVLAADPRELAASVPRIAARSEAGCALLLPLAVRGEVEAVVMCVRRRAEAFEPRSIEHAATLVEQAATALALVRARAEAGTDPVTGCMNHRAMRRRLQEEIGRAMRTGTPLSCLLIDLDNFKLVNDRHGHQAGDHVLREVGQALVGEFRAFDRVARYGGDEFVVILPNADLESAATAASRALARLLALPGSEANPGVGASIGVAQWQAPMGADALLQACDSALLRSKRQGKGRVTRASARAR